MYYHSKIFIFLVRGDEFLGKKPGERVSSKLADRSVKPTPMLDKIAR